MKSTASARCGVGFRPKKISTLSACRSSTELPQEDFDELSLSVERLREVPTERWNEPPPLVGREVAHAIRRLPADNAPIRTTRVRRTRSNVD